MALVLTVELTVMIPPPTVKPSSVMLALFGSADRMPAGTVRVPADAGATHTNSPAPLNVPVVATDNGLSPIT